MTMTSTKYNRVIFFLIIMTIIAGCENDSSPQPMDPLAEQLGLLKNDGRPWAASTSASVIKDGYDVTDQFDGFELSFGDFTFNTVNGLASAWPANGTWEFKSGNQNTITRSDGVVIAFTHSGSNLLLTFTSVGDTGGRVKSLEGEYQFQLTSK